MRNARNAVLLLAAVLLSVAVLSQAGCAGVRGRRDAPDQSGFLGDYSQLEPREGHEVHDVYINPDAAWKSYGSVQIDFVTGQRLAAAVDQRAGTKSVLAGTRTFKKWGDVQAACEFWAEGLTQTLVRLGVQVRE